MSNQENNLKIAPMVFLVVIVDQLTKVIAWNNDYDIKINKGITFFLFQENYFAVGLFFAFWFALVFYLHYRKSLMGISFGLLLGGVISNLLDYIRLGGALDWITIYHKVFNLADVAWILGILLWISTKIKNYQAKQ